MSMNETFKIYLHLKEDQLDIIKMLTLILERRDRLVSQSWIELTEAGSIEIKSDKDSDDLETIEASSLQIDLDQNVIVKSSAIATVQGLIDMKILNLTNYEYLLCQINFQDESEDLGYAIGLDSMYQMIDNFLEDRDEDREIQSLSIVQTDLDEIIDWSKGDEDVQ